MLTIPDGHNGFSGVKPGKTEQSCLNPGGQGANRVPEVLYPPRVTPKPCSRIPLLSPGAVGATCTVGCLGGGSWGCGPAKGARPGAEAFCLAAGHCLHRAPPGSWGASGRKGSSAPPPPGAGRCPAQLTGQHELKGAGASAGQGHRIVPTKLSRTELLEYKVRQLLLALQRRDVIYIFSFLEDYHEFATTDEVLDLLFTEAISCMLEIWLDYYGDDFCQFPEFASLMRLLQLLRQHMPGTDAHLRALRYLRQFRHLQAHPSLLITNVCPSGQPLRAEVKRPSLCASFKYIEF
ncbi:uncharacterized protein AAEQ78_019130 [Lycaon pictus]